MVWSFLSRKVSETTTVLVRMTAMRRIDWMVKAVVVTANVPDNQDMQIQPQPDKKELYFCVNVSVIYH